MVEKTFRVRKGLDVEGPDKDASIINGVLTLGTIGNISGASSSILAINSLGSVNINLDTNTNDTNSVFRIREDNTDFFVMDNDGQVGIGTSSPAKTLDVAGDIGLTGDIYVAENKKIYFDSTDTYIYADTDSSEDLKIGADGHIELEPDNDLIVKTGSTEYVRFDGSTERVGIGTDTPSYDLHVVGSGYFTDDLRVGATSPTKITLNGNDAYVEGQFEASGTAGSYIYSLALGTASPTASSAGKFETSGDVKAGSMTIGGHTFDDIDIGTEFVDADDHIMSSGAIKEKIESYNYLASVDISANTNLAVSSPITLTGDTVGLADPATLSQLTESTDATDDKILLWDESGSSWKYMTLDNLQDSIDTSASGGATNLGGLSDVLISNDSIFINNFGGTPATGSLTSATDNVAIGKDALRIITSADHNIAIGDQAGYDITTGSKNVLIGVEAGGDTDSGIDLSVFIGQHAGLRMKGNENIAIGDNSMTGSSTKADNTGTNNIAIGSPTMNAVTTGSDNVALGQLTLTALTEGSSNVAVGYNALDTLTTGDDNVAIGQYALHQHTTGSDNVSIGPNTMRGAKNTSSTNVAIGKSAGYYMGANGNNIGIGEFATRGSTVPNNNTGQDNIGIGYKTLFVHTGADYNVALGYEAATAITGGDKNVAIGYRSLYAGQSTIGNVAIGTAAMDTITGGDYNVALGFDSMGSTDTDLSDNIAIGREAGLYMGSSFNIALGFEAVHGSSTASNNTGVRNIGIGYQAAREYTTGQDNIAVGYQAMESITTGSTNVAIGDRALDALTTGSNNIAIGALAGSTTSTDMTGGIFLGVQSGLYMDGDYNIGIGYTAVEGSSTTGNNTGNHNVGIGYQPMMEVTSGYKNVAIGYYAGQDITTGRGNVAIGEDAGQSITTGDFNVTIGNDAGDSLQGGDDNIFIGRNAGQNVTSGSDNVVIGAGVGDLRDATGTKQLLLKSGSDTWLEGFGGDMYFGQNTNYHVPASTSSNNTAGSVLKFGGGAGTGTASGGDLKLQYAPAGGSSNTTHNSYSDALTVSGSTGDVTIHNKLIVSGTTTTLNTETMTVEDHNIVLGSGNATAEVVDGAGLTLEGGSGDDITFQYNTTDNRMELKHGSAFEDFKAGVVTGTFVGGLTGNASTATLAAKATALNTTSNGIVKTTSSNGTISIGSLVSGDIPNNAADTSGNAATATTAGGLSSTLAVSSGGTGATTLTSNAVLTGNGTNAVQAESNFTYDGNTLTVKGNDGVTALTDDPIVLVRPILTSSRDAALKIQGSRNGSTSANTAALILSNQDDNLSNANEYNHLGAIVGRVTDTTDNHGDMHFLTFSDGATANDTMTLKGTGNVGIGTTSPDAHLHVEGSGVQKIRIESTDNQAGLEILSDSTNKWVMYSPNSSDDLRFWTDDGDTDVMILDTSGNVTIPNGSLTIGSSTLTLDGSSNKITGLSDIEPAAASGSDTAGTNLIVSGGNSTGTGVGGDIILKTAPAGGSSGSSANTLTERMRIHDTGDTEVKGNLTGRIEHGTGSNLYRFGGLYFTWDADNYGTNLNHSITSTENGSFADSLTINSFDKIRFNMDTNSNNSDSYIQFGRHSTGTGGDIFMTIDDDGDVGLGTATPTAKLHVLGTTTIDPTGTYSAVVGGGSDTSTTAAITTIGAANWYYESNGYLRNVIGHTTGGDITIGHQGTSMWDTIDLIPGHSGKIRMYSDDGSASSSGLTMTIDDQKVGIGTASPAAQLHVGSTAYEVENGIYLTGSHQRTAKMVIHADDANTDWDEQEIGLALHNEDPTNNNWSPHIAFTTHEDDDGNPANANPVAVAAISATYNTRVANGWAKGDLVFFTNNAGSGNAERMRITGAGNVGIGVTPSAAKLEVGDGTDLASINPTYVQLYNSNGSGSNATVKLWAETWGGKVGTTSSDDFFIVSANSDRMKFDGSMRTTFYGSSSADPIIRLSTGDTTVSAGDDLGVIEWAAGSEGDGTDGDARLVAASISAVAEANFTDTANTTSLVFKTGTSEAATEKMRLLSTGQIELSGTTTGAPADTNHVRLGFESEVLRIDSNEGYLQIGAQNTTYMHMITDRGKFYFNRELVVNEGIISSYDENLTLQRINTTADQIIIAEDAMGFTVGSAAVMAITNPSGGASPQVTVAGSLTLQERASAPGDNAGYGQLWVKNDGDGELYFTDDNGTDIQLTDDGAATGGGGGGAVSAVANGSNNRIATFSSASALNGEANLTFDGSTLALAGKQTITVADTVSEAFKVTITDSDSTADSTPFVVDGNGRVGIGTASPLSDMALTLNGDGTTYEGLAFQSGGSTKWKLSSDGSAFYHDSQVNTLDYNLRLRDSSGNYNTMNLNADTAGTIKMGLGVTPVALLHVKADSSSVSQSSAGSANITIEQDGTGDAALNFLLTSVQRWMVGIDNSDSDKFKIETGATSLGSGAALTIATNGDMGINQTSPAALLHIKGSENSWDKHIRLENHDTTDYGAIVVDNQGMKFRCFTNGHDFHFRDNDNNTLLQIQDGAGIKFNNAYTFPTSDGSANQVLTTNGSGVLTFENAGGGSSTDSFMIFGEESDDYLGPASAGNSNGFSFSYGNGAQNTTKSSSGADFGMPLGCDCTLKALYIHFGNKNSRTSSTNMSIDIFKNQAGLNDPMTGNASGSGGNAFVMSKTNYDIDFDEGDTFNIRVESPTSYSTATQIGPARFTAYFERR